MSRVSESLTSDSGVAHAYSMYTVRQSSSAPEQLDPGCCVWLLEGADQVPAGQVGVPRGRQQVQMLEVPVEGAEVSVQVAGLDDIWRVHSHP